MLFQPKEKGQGLLEFIIGAAIFVICVWVIWLFVKWLFGIVWHFITVTLPLWGGALVTGVQANNPVSIAIAIMLGALFVIICLRIIFPRR